MLAWVVTKQASNWVSIQFGSHSLRERVARLRCGLDRAEWDGDSKSRCADLLAINPENAPKETDPLPFDLVSSHALFEALFGQIAHLIKDKQLLIVPSGPLTRLPFHVLVTQKPDQFLFGTKALGRAAWFAKANSITILPAVSSLKVLRERVKPSRATKALIAFGNPLLDGRDYRDGPRAELSRARQQCPQAPLPRLARLTGRGADMPQRRGGLADLANIRAQVPLPETADELCAVARSLGVPESEIRLGARASEREIKRLSDNSELANYRIVHLATHGALAGELKAGAEPGLILTPPDEATPEDDGYLSASEIAGLKLDANLVILSACNTAGGEAPGADALSGMARAFFYAGARSLLVSHWAVDSDSTVKLITKALAIMSADKSVGRAEAMRRSMLAMIESRDPKETHPAHWAPFVVVGEGSGINIARSPITTSGKKHGPNAKEPWTMDIWRN
jgi:CHAT domain-containing protein